jgi:hypothetical protein
MTYNPNIRRNLSSLALGLASLASVSQLAYAEPKSAEVVKATCDAKGSYYKLTAPHKAGEVNAKTGAAFKRDSNGVCHFDTAKAKEALASK